MRICERSTQLLFPTLNRGKNHQRHCGPIVLWDILLVHLLVLELQGFDQVMKSTPSSGNQRDEISGFDGVFLVSSVA